MTKNNTVKLCLITSILCICNAEALNVEKIYSCHTDAIRSSASSDKWYKPGGKIGDGTLADDPIKQLGIIIKEIETDNTTVSALDETLKTIASQILKNKPAKITDYITGANFNYVFAKKTLSSIKQKTFNSKADNTSTLTSIIKQHRQSVERMFVNIAVNSMLNVSENDTFLYLTHLKLPNMFEEINIVKACEKELSTTSPFVAGQYSYLDNASAEVQKESLKAVLNYSVTTDNVTNAKAIAQNKGFKYFNTEDMIDLFVSKVYGGYKAISDPDKIYLLNAEIVIPFQAQTANDAVIKKLVTNFSQITTASQQSPAMDLMVYGLNTKNITEDTLCKMKAIIPTSAFTAKMTSKIANGATILHVAATGDKKIPLVFTKSEIASMINQIDSRGNTPLNLAYLSKKTDRVNEITSAGLTKAQAVPSQISGQVVNTQFQVINSSTSPTVVNSAVMSGGMIHSVMK